MSSTAMYGRPSTAGSDAATNASQAPPPGAIEVAWAELILSVAANADGVAVRVNGRTVDASLVGMAERIVAAAALPSAELPHSNQSVGVPH